MNYVKVLFRVEVLVCVVVGIKVNMQGNLNIGKDVMDSLSYYLGSNVLSGRRSLMPAPIDDPITLAVRSALLCKDLDMCQDELQNFVNEYIIILAKAVESIMMGSLPEFTLEWYEEHLKHIMEKIRKILEDANAKAEDDVHRWIGTTKRISAKYQEILHVVIPNVKSEKADDKLKVRGILNHKIVIVTEFIERKYEIKLCVEHDLCSNSYECTRALNKILIHFETLPEDKIRTFLRYVYESLFNTSFYTHMSHTAANEFQIVLNDMVYSNDTSTKEIMSSVHKTIESRLEIIKTNKALPVAHDILIAHAILSDLDYMFRNRTDPYIAFLNKFYDWLASDIPISKHTRAVMSDISKEVWLNDADLVHKLINEVNVFLEMTVGPEK